MVIENVHNFFVFYKLFALQSLWGEHFFELVDNGLLSCMSVVAVNS